MRRMLALVVCVAALSCGGTTSSPTTPTTPTVSACQSNNTATVTFENRSASNKTYTVVWDGSNLTTLAPTQKSQAYTVAAGVQHTLTFKVTNSSALACSTSSPTLAQCSSNNYWCTT